MLRTTAVTLAATLALAGCGGDDQPADETGSTNGQNGSAAPAGELLADGIGPVSQGDSRDRVRELFGPPDRTQRPPACEFDSESLSVVQATYELPDGSLSLNFDAGSDELTAYLTDSERFATQMGDRVGDSFTSLRDSWGDQLKPLKIGTATPTASLGNWVVGQDSRSELLFNIQDGRIATISGGYLPVCE